MPPITWKNIAAPDFSGTTEALKASGEAVGRAGASLQKVLSDKRTVDEGRWEGQKARNTAEILRRRKAIGGLDEFNEQISGADLEGEFGAQFDAEKVEAGTATQREDRIFGVYKDTLEKTGDTGAASDAAYKASGGDVDTFNNIAPKLDKIATYANQLTADDQDALSNYEADLAAATKIQLQNNLQVGNQIQAQLTSLDKNYDNNSGLAEVAQSHAGGVAGVLADEYSEAGFLDSKDSIKALKEVRRSLDKYDIDPADRDAILIRAFQNTYLDRFGGFFDKDKGIETKQLLNAAHDEIGPQEKIIELRNRHAAWSAANERDSARLTADIEKKVRNAKRGMVRGKITGSGFDPANLSTDFNVDFESAGYATSAFDKYKSQLPGDDTTVIENKDPASKQAPAPDTLKRGTSIADREATAAAVDTPPTRGAALKKNLTARQTQPEEEETRKTETAADNTRVPVEDYRTKVANQRKQTAAKKAGKKPQKRVAEAKRQASTTNRKALAKLKKSKSYKDMSKSEQYDARAKLQRKLSDELTRIENETK